MAEFEKNIVPYGVQNFADLRRRGLYYVDKTAFIRELELRSDKLFFVRPRRMGKSLFVDMLARYYDLAEKDSFRELFGDLAIGKRPTHYLYIHYQDFDQIACEEIVPFRYDSVASGESCCPQLGMGGRPQ